MDKILVGGLTILCNVNGNEIIITGFEGADSRITIPDIPFADRPECRVTAIGKKAFLGAKFLKEISLPGSVMTFEDWAFASCNNLNSLVIRGNGTVVRPHFGKGVFENCNELESILLGYEEKDDMSILLGAAIFRLPAPYLFMDPDIGSDSWFESWDKALLSYLASRDDDGYTDRILCGEEDISYDGIASVDGELLSDGTNYVKETKKRKAYLCFLRLNAPKNLADEYRNQYVSYLIEHGKGCGHEEAWEVLKDELKGRIEFLKLYASIGGIKIELIDDMLISLGEEYAEGKAFLIKYKQDNSGSSDFFSGLLL